MIKQQMPNEFESVHPEGLPQGPKAPESPPNANKGMFNASIDGCFADKEKTNPISIT